MKCIVCEIDYSDGLVHMLRTSSGNGMCCGICALEEGNKVLSIKRTKFTGPTAEKMRLAAIAYREKIKHNE